MSKNILLILLVVGVQAGDGSQRKPVPNPLAEAVPNNCLKKVPAALNLTTSSLLSWPSSSSYVKSTLSFQTEAPPQRRPLLMVQLSPRGRAVRAKKPGNHCCVLGFHAHTHLSRG